MSEFGPLSTSLNALKVTLNHKLPPLGSKEEREAAILAELKQVQHINEAIEAILQTINKVEQDLAVTKTQAKNSDILLETWVKILSQTEHTQKLISNSNWEGTSRDQELVAQREQEKLRKQEEERLQKEALALEEESRRKREQAALAKKKEAQERRNRIGTSRRTTTTGRPTRITNSRG